MEKTSFEVQWLERCFETVLVEDARESRVTELYGAWQLERCRDPNGKPFRFCTVKSGHDRYALWLVEKNGLLHRVPKHLREAWADWKETHPISSQSFEL